MLDVPNFIYLFFALGLCLKWWAVGCFSTDLRGQTQFLLAVENEVRLFYCVGQDTPYQPLHLNACKHSTCGWNAIRYKENMEKSTRSKHDVGFSRLLLPPLVSFQSGSVELHDLCSQHPSGSGDSCSKQHAHQWREHFSSHSTFTSWQLGYNRTIIHVANIITMQQNAVGGAV